MEIKKLDKDLIFYIPGKPGAVFTYSAGFAVDDSLLGQTVENLEFDAEAKVHWVEERRSAPRPA
jgi:hypothetical protein